MSESFEREFGVRTSTPTSLSTVNHLELKAAWNNLRRFDTYSEGNLRLSKRRGERTELHSELFTNSYMLFLLLARPKLRVVR